MKLRKYVIPVLLTIAVIISLVLSVGMWLNPARYGSSRQNSNPNTAKNEEVNKSLGYVYSPTQALYTDENGSQHLMINQSVNTVSEIKKQMKNYKQARMSQMSRDSQEEYLTIANRKNSFMLNYSAAVTMKMVNEIVNDSFNRLDNIMVNRIVVPINDKRHLYLLTDKNWQVYKVTVAEHSLAGLKKILTTGGSEQIAAHFGDLNGAMNTFIDAKMTLQSYRYLVNTQTKDYYVSRLLNDDNSQNIRVKKQGDRTIYTDQNDRTLTIDNKQRMVNYDDYQATASGIDLSSVLTGAYEDLTRLGLSLDNVRMFGYTTKNQTLTYRYFVEGFPVFATQGQGAIMMKNINSSSVSYRFSLNSPQVPIPNSGDSVELKTTQEVIDSLVNLGYKKNKIKQLHIGYTWSKDDSADNLVRLTPDWYVFYDQKWQSYQNLIKTPVSY